MEIKITGGNKMRQIALKGHHHTCPASCGSKAHEGGSIKVGHDILKVNGVPVALVGDTCECSCATDTIIEGSALLTINGVPVALKGSKTAHGGVIVEGDDSLTIG
jgi:uncharacterized Zn-binding protein involved in type VI secretion